jgi:oligopeptide/dipeptide ABC transporter ATP-binding protein
MTQTAPGTEGAGPPADVLLDVSGLEVWYGPEQAGGVRAVHDATFVVRKGEVVGIAGESGSGKSTLAFAIARLLKGSGHITGGSVRWYGPAGDGLDLATASDEKLRQIRWKGVSIVLQSAMSAMNPVLSVRSQIDDVLRAHEPEMSRRQRASRIASLLEMVGIPARRAAAYPHELSGGMRQRAMIAMALALSPQLVILDEPTTALDVVMQRQILERLTELQDDLGFAVLFITHDLSLLLEVSDETLVMYAGAVVEKARAHELYENPRHPYSTGLLRSFPKVAGERQELLGIPGSPPNLRELPPGCAFHPRCPQAMPRCEQEVPQLTWRTAAGQGAARQVACLLYDDRGGGAHPGQRVSGQGNAEGRVSGQGNPVRS